MLKKEDVIVGLAIVALIALVYFFWWFFFVRKHKCTTVADCKAGQVCSGGYCEPIIHYHPKSK